MAPAPSPIRAEQVVSAVCRLFRQYGYRRTSVDDIAREAGLSKATLYLAYPGKEAMFAAMIRAFRQIALDRCHAAEASDAPVARRLAALLYASHGTALEWFGDAAHMRELKSVAAGQRGEEDPAAGDRQAMLRRIERMIARAAADGEIDLARDGIRPAEVAATLLFAADGAKHAQCDGAGGYADALALIVRLVVGPLLRAG